MDGTGFQARLVDSVVEQGVVWVNSSGNYATAHYRGSYSDTNGNGLHEFPDGSEAMAYAPPPTDAVIVLNWDDWEDSEQDFDLFMYDDKAALVASSSNSQNGRRGDEPFETLFIRKPEHDMYFIVIKGKQVTRQVTFDLYAPSGEIAFVSAAYSLGTPADAARALAVGAVDWQSEAIEEFSSQGPTNDGRLKPELCAADGLSTYSYAPEPFYGTSASTPAVAGAVALVLSAFPGYTPAQVTEYLAAHAVDYGPNGEDTAYGYGALQLPPPEFASSRATEQPENTPTSAPTSHPLGSKPRTPTSARIPESEATHGTATALPVAPSPGATATPLLTGPAATATTPREQRTVTLTPALAAALEKTVTSPPSAPRQAPATSTVAVTPAMRRVPMALLVGLGVVMVLGGVGAVTGLALLVVWPRSHKPEAEIGVTPERSILVTEGDPRSLKMERCRVIRHGQNLVGRARDCDIPLVNDNMVSRHHAVISWDGTTCTIEDMGSKNGTFVNGRRLSPGLPHRLGDGDFIDLGPRSGFVLRLPVRGQGQ